MSDTGKSLAAEELLGRLRAIIPWLSESAEKHFFDDALLHSFKSEANNLERSIQIARDDARKLQIGIIGQVKAGKSTFLNALVFDGKQVLPKAATPMTAALTKLSYSKTPSAVVHYYSSEEWGDFEAKNREFEENLNSAYDEYKSNLRLGKNPKTIEEYEMTEFRKTQSEHLLAGRELTQMVKDSRVLEKLGLAEELEASTTDDLMECLRDYVGANGRYTPIVSYVEMRIPEEKLRDLTIIDTPGLNDPIVSRTVKTKEFLGECDVAFLLSPCSQFMDASVIELMARRLPDKGIQHLVVIGSKLDSGLLNLSGKDFKFAYQSSIQSYQKTFRENIVRAKKSAKYGNVTGVIESFAKSEPIFFSSMCFLIDKVLKGSGKFAPGSEEEHTYNNLHRLGGFDDSAMYQLSGMKKIQAALDQILAQKEELISGKNSSVLMVALRAALVTLEQITQGAAQLKRELAVEEDSPEQIKDRYDAMEGILNSSRTKIQALFERAGYEAEKSAVDIKANIGMEMGNYDAFKVEKHVKTEDHVIEHWFKPDDHYTTTDTTYIADTAQIVTNIRGYAEKCRMLANNSFSSLFNEDALKRKLIDVITAAYKQGGYTYDVDDIILPLEAVFAKISIPQLAIDHHKCVDAVNSYYPGGRAENEEVHGLHTLQVQLLTGIADDLEKQVKSSVEGIQRSMIKQSATFVDQISEKIKGRQEDLMQLLEDKERNIQKLNDFLTELKQKKAELSEAF